MSKNNGNPFNLHASKGVVQINEGKITQLQPTDKNGMVYSFEKSDDIYVICPEYSSGLVASTIVCSLSGGKLSRIKSDVLFSFPEAYDAVFYGKELVTVVTHWNLEKNVSLNKVFLYKTSPTTYIVWTQTFWGGDIKKLPENLSCFKKAIDAAEEKKLCQKCDHVHFAERTL